MLVFLIEIMAMLCIFLIMQSCTEMILPTQGNNENSIFPASTYNYTSIASECKVENGVPPRPHWITTEFGGHVSPFIRTFIKHCNVCVKSCDKLNHVLLVCDRISKGY